MLVLNSLLVDLLWQIRGKVYFVMSGDDVDICATKAGARHLAKRTGGKVCTIREGIKYIKKDKVLIEDHENA